MKNLSFISILLSSMLFSSSCFAGVKVLGFELGTSELNQVNSTLTNQTKVTNTGKNKYSHGQMLQTDGTGYSIEGLNSVLYIFDTDNKLSAVILDMDKYKFNDVYSAVASKYKVVSQKRPFVGDQYAKFKDKNATIEIDAPHMSFEMGVRYMQDNFLKSYNEISQAERLAKKTKENSQF